MKQLFLIVLIVSNATVWAQEVLLQQTEPKRRRFIDKIEVFAGPSIAGVHGNSEYNKYGIAKFSYALGLGASHLIGKNWSLNTKLVYEVKGFKQTATAFIPPDYYNNPPTTDLPPEKTEITGNLNNDYISLILLPKYSFGKNHQIHFSAGPYLSRLAKAAITTTDVQRGVVKRKQVINQSETYKDYDYGLSVFIGYTFTTMKKIELSSQVYYSYGLMNVVEMTPGLSPMKNNSLSILITISLLRQP